MSAEVPSVKTTRAYDVTNRRLRAERSDAALLDAALARFLQDGYAKATIESIAADAGVSVATIYKRHTGKAGLVSALCTRALAGRGSVPAEQRSDELQATETDPRTIIRGWGRLVAEVSPRIAPILLLLRDAASHDPDAAALFVELDERRLTRMSHNAVSIVKTGGLRPGVSKQQVRDVLWLYSSPELYDLLVRRRNWSVMAFARFVTSSMEAALL